MIPLTEINQFAKKYGVPAETIEKDYVICWMLRCLSESFISKNFIFYGGTAIKRMHFEDHRFSEDIDLISSKKIAQEKIISDLETRLSKAKEWTNLVLTVNHGLVLQADTRLQIYVNYAGYDEIVGAPKEVRFDFAMDMDLYGEVEQGTMFNTYSDLRRSSTAFPVMTLNTILAGKLGLLASSTRKEPRDLYDIWYLLERLDQFDLKKDKLGSAFKSKYGFDLSLSVLEPHLINESYRQNWETRLAKQIADLPAIDHVLRATRRHLKALLGKE